jgi:hypothetical protein
MSSRSPPSHPRSRRCTCCPRTAPARPPPGRRAHRPGRAGGHAGRRARRWSTRSAAAGRPGRGREHLPHRRPARAVQPLRLPRHHPDHDPAVLQAGRASVGRARHGRPLVGRHRQADRARPGRRPPRRGHLPPGRRHDVPVRTLNQGDRHTGESISLRRQRILAPEDIRALPRGTALLLATACKAALIDLAPWYSGPAARAVAAAVQTAQRQLTARASQSTIGAPR